MARKIGPPRRAHNGISSYRRRHLRPFSSPPPSAGELPIILAVCFAASSLSLSASRWSESITSARSAHIAAGRRIVILAGLHIISALMVEPLNLSTHTPRQVVTFSVRQSRPVRLSAFITHLDPRRPERLQSHPPSFPARGSLAHRGAVPLLRSQTSSFSLLSSTRFKTALPRGPLKCGT